MLDKLKTNYKVFLVTCLLIAIAIYAIVGFWIFSAILLAAIIGISTESASAVMFIMFVLWSLFAMWREEARDD